MKVDIREDEDRGIWVDIAAETPAEAALLVRMALNERKAAPEIFVSADKATVNATVIIRQSKEFKSYIKK